MIETPRPASALRITAYSLRPWHADAQQLGFADRPAEKARQLQSFWARFGETIIHVAGGLAGAD